MFEKYTEKARRVIFFARYEASQFGSPYIETEHLLLGLIREGKGLTSRIFARSHLSLESIRKEIEGRTVFREKVSTSVEIPFSAETKRVLQVGSQTTSSDQWWKVRKAIQDGLIGKLIMSQGSFHRNSKTGEWNWPIDKNAGPDKTGDDFIDWKMWLGDAPKRPYDADRFFRFRKYWDYSGGIATDLFVHLVSWLHFVVDARAPKFNAMGAISGFASNRDHEPLEFLIGASSA